jgi:cell wall-associated NlpC family hydrolase
MFSISGGLFLAREWKWIIAGVATFLVLIMMLIADAMSSTSTTQSSCSDSIILTGNDNGQKIWNFLTSNQVGLTPIAASGVLGNMAQESQLNPAEEGGGLCQWINDRWSNLVAYANQNNNEDVNALSTQLGFFLQELRSGQHGSISELNSQSTPALAAVYFERAFEGAGIPRLDKRITYANSFYSQFAGMPTATPVSQPVISNICGSGSSNYSNVPASDQAQKVIVYAEQFLGLPYVWGGATPAGFDCSGLMMYSFRNALGINLPRTAAEQQLVGTRIPTDQVQPGDLVFMGFPAFHVGMYIGGGKWIESPETGDSVKIVPYNPVKFTSATRVIN